MKKLLILMGISLFSFAEAQIVIKGKVMTKEREALAFVNIGIKNKNKGTISTEKGFFTLHITEINKADTLCFSMVGYQDYQVKIDGMHFSEENTVILNAKPKMLPEVQITVAKPKLKKIGTQSYSTFVAGYVRANNNQNNDIQEFAKKIVVKKPSMLKDINMHLFMVKKDTATFRINVYTIKNDLPSEKINTENRIVTQKIQNGWNTFDLSHFNIQFQEPVFVSLEYLPQKFDEQEPFRYSGQVFGSSITRTASMGKWTVKSGLSMALYVTVLQ